MNFNRNGNYYQPPVPYHQEPENSFDTDYSFHGRLEPLTFPNSASAMFSRDDFFNSFNSHSHELMRSMQNAFRDDSSSILNRFMRSPRTSLPSIMMNNINHRMAVDPFTNMTSSLMNNTSPSANTMSHSHQMTQMMSYSNIDGKPKLIQSHDEEEIGPYGVRRTRKAHRNTEKGIEKMQEGHFIDSKGEIREKYKNPGTNAYQQEVYYQNLSPQEQSNFGNRWQNIASQAKQAFNLPIHRVTSDNGRGVGEGPHYPQLLPHPATQPGQTPHYNKNKTKHARS